MIGWNWLKVFRRRASRFVGHINSPGFLSGVWPIEHLNRRIKSYLMKGVIIKEMIAAQTALGRIGVPDDIGGVIAFLCSEEARWVNGQRLEVSGGIFL